MRTCITPCRSRARSTARAASSLSAKRWLCCCNTSGLGVSCMPCFVNGCVGGTLNCCIVIFSIEPSPKSRINKHVLSSVLVVLRYAHLFYGPVLEVKNKKGWYACAVCKELWPLVSRCLPGC